MRARWTRAALADLARAREQIARDNPLTANELALRIIDASGQVLSFPAIGRGGHAAGTRETVVADTPYVLIYRVRKDEVQFVRVWDTRRGWPVH